MKKILIMLNADPNSNPRPNRMIEWLKKDYDLTVVARNEFQMSGVQSYAYNPRKSLKGKGHKVGFLGALLHKINGDFVGAFTRFFLRLVHLALGRYDEVNWLNLGHARTLIASLSKEQFDLIISHDLVLLPLAFGIRGEKTKIMLDAREYYPMNFNDDWVWRITKKPVNEYLCNTYLQRCDKVLTVSPGLSDEYRREYGIEAEVIMSLPAFQELGPSPQDSGKIRMVHHGNANPSRKTELMLEMMDYVDDRFSLDLMLVVTSVSYWNKIVEMAESRKNVQVIPPVPMHDIVKTINQYDIGLYLASPGNFNVKYMLPNKLFEFIQARLAIAIGPSIEMKKIVEKYECGIVSQDFSPLSLAHELNHLTAERLDTLKQHAHQAAQELNAEVNGKRIHEIVKDLLRE